MNKDLIPNSFSDITVDWLNSVLSSKFLTKILSFELGSPIEEGYTGEIFRIIPKYNDKSDSLPISLIIKLATKNPGINKLLTETRGYEKEIKLYPELSKINSLNLPKIYYSNINIEKSKYVLIMEDLNNRNLKLCKLEEGFDANFALKVIDFFSKFQSEFWGPEKYYKLKFMEEYNFSLYLKDLTIENFNKRKNRFIEENKTRLGPKIIELINNIDIIKLYESTNPEDKKNFTLVHGDAQLSNLFYDEKNIIMIDWQYSSLGIGLKDVIILLGISLNEKTTKDEIENLKNIYYEKLKYYGVKDYSKDNFNVDWKNCLLLSLANIISVSNEENIGDDNEKKKKYQNYLDISSRRFIHFIQFQEL